ncbi:c-type cytochrome [Halomonas korlensis]|uniref:Cytochrome c n=1 Tax=Halomonas korlensis TaxID=463301 RepID=A0A1I7IBT7_9GAMM|nr:c-type cytochrome [Halomonas korlensis]SFU70409.1 Cytochrome c [Halomonas korlensis]
MTDKTPYRERSATRRLVYGGLGAVIFFGIGSLIYDFGLFSWMTGTRTVLSESEQHLKTATQARRQLEEERTARRDNPDAPAPAQPTGEAGYFVPPGDEELPDGPFGESVERGREIFRNTGTNAGEFVGNDLSCANCHLDTGKRENSAPMWAAAIQYPAFRGKNQMVNTMEDRVNGCFTYSMNAQDSEHGDAPPPGHQVYKDLQSYFYWLADGAALNEDLPGRGYPSVEETDQGYDWQRGQQVFTDNCAACHGIDGQGQQDLNGRTIFPPLWGPGSYNWGAGMHRINTAAGFIQANMPLGKPNSLTDQEAWDVAAYINSFPRPADPRQTDKMDVSTADERFHEGSINYYGDTLHGVLLGEGITQERWERFLRTAPFHEPGVD